MKQSYQFLISIIVILGGALFLVIIEYNELRLSHDSLQNEKLQVDELIQTFKEKYAQHKIVEDLDSKGIPYKYSVNTDSNEIELLLEKDRVVLKAWKDNDALCIVSNPMPRDIVDNCPLKW